MKSLLTNKEFITHFPVTYNFLFHHIPSDTSFLNIAYVVNNEILSQRMILQHFIYNLSNELEVLESDEEELRSLLQE